MDTIVKAFIASHSDFTTGEFTDVLVENYPDIGRSTVFYYLKSLCDTGAVTRVSRGRFEVSGNKKYCYELSDTAKSISALISKSYPLVCFQIWEFNQMNEFVNHLLSHNTIIVEVEDVLDETVFNMLFKLYPHVLLNPTDNEYYKYHGDETIVVRKLISEAPPSYGALKQASLEKILVDLFGRGISGSIISKSEYKAIYEDSFEKYSINQAKMFRYARRRGIGNKIKSFIQEETDIVLEAG